jgi:hypothetical protein
LESGGHAHPRYAGDSSNVQIYVGRLFDKTQPDEADWNRLISRAEQLLIYTHAPAMNSSNINTISKDDAILEEIKEYRVVNYDNYKDLLPEVSGDIYLNQLSWYKDTHIFAL